MDCRAIGRFASYCSLLTACLAGALGCNGSPRAITDSTTDAGTTPPVDDKRALAKGEEIAEKMLAAYRQAGRYTDHATYVQHSVYRGEGVERDLPFFHMSVAFERPNRLRLSFEEAVEGSAGRKGFDIASDGKFVRCQVGELPGQVQESAAPSELSADNLLPDPLVREVFSNRTLGDVFPQLAMLLNRDQDGLVFPDDESPRLLGQATLRDRECFRVASTSPKGQRIFWIDSENYTLHRMELPIEAERDRLDADGQYSQLAIWIDFEAATIDAQIDAKAFEMEVPADAKRVRRFVKLPPAAPPEQLGKPVGDFQFTTPGGEKVTASDLEGKIALLDFWQVDCAPCKAHTPNLEQVYQQLKSEEKFAFYAVNLDGSRIDDETAVETLKSWGGSIPVLLDGQQDAFKKLNVEATPTLMLLDGKGQLQYLHTARHDDPAALAELVKKVIGGGDLAAEARAEHRQLTAKFRSDLEAATIKDETLDVELASAEISERALPEKLAASEMWTTKKENLAYPGNLLLLAGDDESLRIAVLDGGDAIVELDEKGQRTARHEIAAGEAPRSGNGFVRTSSGDETEGRHHVVSGVGWQKLYVYDSTWKLVLEFPKDRHPGIADVQLLSTGDPAEPRICVGYWGGVGVQGVGLDGKRKWSERTLDQVVQLTAARTGESDGVELWCTSNRGTLLVLNEQGRPRREVVVGRFSLMHLAVAGAGESATCCGLAVEGVGRYRAVGFKPDGNVQWQYELPAGEYSHAVDRIQRVTLPGGDEAWMIAAADGSIVWLDADGKLVDKFQVGQTLTGLALANRGDFGILLVSTPAGLTAWKLEKK